MVEAIYPNTLKYHGPWLVDSSQLEALDQIIESEWPKLLQYREQRIQEAVDKKMADQEGQSYKIDRSEIIERVKASYEFCKGERLVRIYYKNNRELKATSFKEAMHDQTFADDKPIAASVSVACGEVQVGLSISSGSAHLQVAAEPINNPLAREFRFKLEQWAKSASSPSWLKIWRTFNGLQWALLLLIVFLNIGLAPYSSEIARQELRAEIHEFLHKGVNESNLPQGVAYLLALEAGYYKNSNQSVETKRAKRFLIILLGSVILCGIMSFPPSVRLGIGKGEDSVKRWRFWSRFVAITVPGVIISSFVLPIIVEKISTAFATLWKYQ